MRRPAVLTPLLLAALASSAPVRLQAQQGTVRFGGALAVIAPTNQGPDILRPYGSSSTPPPNTKVRLGAAPTLQPEVHVTLSRRLSLVGSASLSRHAVRTRGGFEDLGAIAHTWLALPAAALTLRLPSIGAVEPFLGAGAAHYAFFGTTATDAYRARVNGGTVQITSNATWLADVGADLPIGGRRTLSARARYVPIDVVTTLAGQSFGSGRNHNDPRPVILSLHLAWALH